MKLDLALLLRLLLAGPLVLPAFRASASVVLTTLHSFSSTNDGAQPYAGLVQGSDGYFYGTTENGGANGRGTVFRISANEEFTNLYSFGSITDAAGAALDGAYPEAELVQASNGNFYGTTFYGGTNAYGTVFKISTNGALTTLYDFGTVTNATGDPLDGANPSAGLRLGSDGYLYGSAVNGDTNGNGTLFKISTDGVLTNLYSFSGTSDGSKPWAGLVQGSDGYFYGTTESGGRSNSGTVFKISSNGVLTNLHSFTNGNDGTHPYAGLVQGSDGYLYGTTQAGGTNDLGTVFKISNGALVILYTFGSVTDAGPYPLDGAAPIAGLVQGSDGYLYGTAEFGGVNDDGTVFRISTNGTLTNLYSFGGGNGGDPKAGLIQGTDGSFYGTTYGGGTYGDGTVFRLTIVPEIQAVTLITNNMLSLTWSTEAGGTYQLQYNSDLSSSNWSNLGDAFIATGASAGTTDSLTNGQRFYRLVLSP